MPLFRRRLATALIAGLIASTLGCDSNPNGPSIPSKPAEDEKTPPPVDKKDGPPPRVKDVQPTPGN